MKSNLAAILDNVKDTVTAGDIELCKLSVETVKAQGAINHWRMLAAVANVEDEGK